jgi:hypothetical protein
MKRLYAAGSILRQATPLTGKNDMHRETPFAQVACGDEGITTVVARPGEDQQRRPLDTTKRRREIGRRQPRALHQRLIGGGALDAAQLGGTVERF